MKKYKVDITLGGVRDTVYTFEWKSEKDAIRFAVGIMKLQYNKLTEDGWFVYSVKAIE